MKQKTIAIIHFNTPELTEALVKSIRKHGGEEYKVVIFDNSDERLFTKKMKGVKALERMGYDLRQQGLYQGCFEVQRDNRTNNDINDLTFALLCLMGTGSIERIDQTITSAVINRFYGNLKVLPVGEDIITDGDLMTWYFHNSDKAIPQKMDLISPIFAGKPVTCFYPNSKKE